MLKTQTYNLLHTTLSWIISEGTLVSFPDKSLGDSDVREFRAVKAITKGQAPNLG
jgi:hypothetical protein